MDAADQPALRPEQAGGLMINAGRLLAAVAFIVLATLLSAVWVAVYVLLPAATLWPLWVALAALKYLWTGTLL